MLQSNGENIAMWEDRLQTYLEATHGVIGTFMRRGKYLERRFPTVAEIANKYEIDENDVKAMLKEVYSTHMKTEAKDEQAKTGMKDEKCSGPSHKRCLMKEWTGCETE
jgi:DNA-directed RNA polymerase specialized sigma subunit